MLQCWPASVDLFKSLPNAYKIFGLLRSNTSCECSQSHGFAAASVGLHQCFEEYDGLIWHRMSVDHEDP